ncbi:conserved membrane hypothetical protein [Candidatus Terasakiella magnetica]|nr:conserved membrane hypothetical protein [Candidatus Terasakiella magnetica]
MTNPSRMKDATAGAIGAVIIFPTILNCGSIIAQPIGPEYAVAGITAAFGATILVSLLRGVLAGPPLHMVSPKSNYAAMVAAMLAGAAALPSFAAAFPSADDRAAMLLVVCFFCTALVGLIQFGLGISRMVRFIKFIPYPVVAGFINGFAINLLASQIPSMLGEASWPRLLAALSGQGSIHPGAAALGLVSLAVTLFAPWLEKRVQPAIWGLVIGTAGYWLLGSVLPGLELGNVIGAVPPALPASPQFSGILALAVSPAMADLAPHIIATAVMLALIMSLQSLINISAADAVLGTRHDSNRELILQGIGNFSAGLLGGVPTGGSSSTTRTVLECGGRGRTANIVHGLVLLAMMAGLGQVIGLIPMPVMAGVVVASTLNQTDDWSRKLLRQIMGQNRRQWGGEVITNLGLVATVTVTVVGFGIFPALIAGMVLAFSVFVRQSSQSVIRRTISGTYLRSRTSRPALARSILDQVASQLVLVEAQGAVFFGSADQLSQHLEAAAAGCRVVIVDLKRVTDIDSSGVVMLERLDKTLSKAGCRLLLAHVGADSPFRRILREMGFARIVDQGGVFEDRDSALSASEDLLLQSSGMPSHQEIECRIGEFDIFKGLSAQDLGYLAPRLTRIDCPAGIMIVREGDPGDAIFLLATGRVSVSRAVEGRTIRFGSHSPGISFGEIGVLTGRPRAADVHAETDVVVWRFDGEVFREISRSQPQIAEKIVGNICLGLSDLVSSLSDMVRELEQ